MYRKVNLSLIWALALLWMVQRAAAEGQPSPDGSQGSVYESGGALPNIPTSNGAVDVWALGKVSDSGEVGKDSSDFNQLEANLVKPDTGKNLALHTSKSGVVNDYKMQVLGEIFDKLQELNVQETITVQTLFTIYERLAILAPSKEPINEHETILVTRILQSTNQLARKIERKRSNNYFNTPSISVVVRGDHYGVAQDNLVSHDSIFTDQENNATDFFSIAFAQFVNIGLYRNSEIVIYQVNQSPLRPLPVTKQPIKWFRVIDFFLAYQQMQDKITLPGIELTKSNRESVGNMRYGCLRWNDTDTAWSSHGCTLINTGFLQIECLCHLHFNGEFSQYILYQYENAIQSTIHAESLPKTNRSNTSSPFYYTYHQPVLNNLFEDDKETENLPAFLIQYLTNVTILDVKDLSDETTQEILEDIGKILSVLKPDEGRNTLGYRNDLIAGFVVQTELANENDLPTGFGFYENYLSGIECLMMTEEIDGNILFSNQMNFSLLFSKSVVQQNSKFSFLVYPPDKYFKPTAYINGQRVLQMRVVDILLTPNNREEIEDQYVHMYYGFPTPEYLFSCAFWSTALNNWTTEGCAPNPRLYLGVCSCNMDASLKQSRTRGQFIMFNYYFPDFYNFETEMNYMKRDFDETSKLIGKINHINVLEMYLSFVDPISIIFDQLSKILLLTSSTGLYYQLKNSTRREFVENVRYFLTHNPLCTDDIKIIQVLCSNNDWSSRYGLTFKPKRIQDVNLPVMQSIIYPENPLVEREISLQASESAFIRNERITTVFYPTNEFLYPPPSIGQRLASRVVDVILKPRANSAEIPQFVTFTFERPTNQRLGCSVWDNVANDWTTLGCQVVRVAADEVCNCSVAGYGGQFIAYSYIDVVLDQDALEQFLSESFTESISIFDQGTAIISNVSQLTMDTRSVVAMLDVFRKMLRVMDHIPDGIEKIQPALGYIETAFQRLCVQRVQIFRFRNQFRDSVNVMSAELFDDMFSNAVLSSGVNSNILTCSDMAVVTISFVDLSIFRPDEKSVNTAKGFFYNRENCADIKFISTEDIISEVLKDNPLFACSLSGDISGIPHRAAFIIYPMNSSPFHYTMTTTAVFNSRQVDVYTFSARKNWLKLEVYFQPTDKPKSYIKTGCAVWDDTTRTWVNDLCSMDYIARYESCTCDLATEKSVTRIIIYEYTDLPNFSLSYFLGGTSVVYIVGSTLSLIGLIMIGTTAILFPEWRKEVSNKILIQLALSHFLYLTLTMFRETHTVYADMKHLDVGLVVFTVLVHYTRLVHHCWGLVMSVLQYKRFSGVVGASATSHLLLKVSAFAWGTPLLPLAVLLSWDIKTHFCTPDKLTHYMLYLVPVVVITMLNIGLLVAIIRVITNGCGLWDDKELQRHGSSKKDVLLRQLKQTVMMFFLFGIPAVFEMFNDLVFHSTAMVYINKALDPIQGFIMYLFFIVINDKTRALWNVHVFGDLPPAVNKPVVRKIKFQRKAAKRRVVKPDPIENFVCNMIESGSDRLGTGSSVNLVMKALCATDLQREDEDKKMKIVAGSLTLDAGNKVGNERSKAKRDMLLATVLDRYRDNARITSLLLQIRDKFAAADEEKARLLNNQDDCYIN